MGIFSRFRDIMAANINSMLDKAEDPEKMLKLMIREMEDTLVEMKAGCAGSIASRTRVERALEESALRAANWEKKARLALEKGREDLAREALAEKRHFRNEVTQMEDEVRLLSEQISHSLDEIRQLETKLENSRMKLRDLVQRHQDLTKAGRPTVRASGGTGDPFQRFDDYEARLRRLEEEGKDSPASPPSPPSRTSQAEWQRLESEDAVQAELESLKREVRPAARPSAPGTPGGSVEPPPAGPAAPPAP